MADSRAAQLLESFVDRLKTVTTANGYNTNVIKVFNDEIPMGLDLEEYELPAILVIAGKTKYTRETQWLVCDWFIELQLIHRHDVPDRTMENYVADIAKAIAANSPTIRRNDSWRVFNGKPTEVYLTEKDTDLNMIEGNRFYMMTYVISYHAHPTDL